MIALAVICTLIVGVIGAYPEPVAFAVLLPAAVMGGFLRTARSLKSDRLFHLSLIHI